MRVFETRIHFVVEMRAFLQLQQLECPTAVVLQRVKRVLLCAMVQSPQY